MFFNGDDSDKTSVCEKENDVLPRTKRRFSVTDGLSGSCPDKAKGNKYSPGEPVQGLSLSLFKDINKG